MEKITELYVLMDNRPKTSAEVCRILKKKRISIYAIGVFIDTGRFYVSHPEKASEVLRENGYEVEEREVIKEVLPNKQGALMELTTKLGNAEINIEYLYGAMEVQQKRGTIIMEVDKPDLAIELFRNHSY